jgi:filamentous hemagglutinin
LYNNVEGDVVYQAATGKGYERSSNKSSGYGVGVYADSKSQGFTVNANTAKGYGNGETTTNANSHVTVGGTTYQNIGGDLVLDGAVVKGDHMSGHIDGAILAKSRPDTATYTGKQTNAGVSADIGFDGVPQSVSVNAGRSKVNADYAAVKEQTGIAMNSSDVVVAKASRFDGAYFTTATPEDNQTVFKEGVTTTDIQNHMNYKGDAINVGLGAGINSETQKVSPPGISGIGYGKDGDSQTSTTYSAVTGIAGKSDVTTANVGTLNETLVNSFDKDRVNAQTNAQVSVTQAFGQEAPKAVAEFSQNRINAIKADPNLTPDQKLAEIKKWDEGGVYRVAMHTAIGALGGGTVESALVGGGVAAAAPLINDLEEKIARRLTEQGMGKESAKSVAKSLTSFTLAGVGSTVGLETSSTATAINIDSNNRWLHESEIQKILANNGDKVRQFAKEQNITFEEAWRAILAQAYRNTDDQFRNNHTPKPGTKESTLAMAAEAFLRKNVVIKSTAAERQNHDLNRSNPRTNAILWAVENRTPTYSTTQKNTQIAKQVAKTSGIGVLKGVGNIPSDTVNGVVAPFGRSVPQTFPYSNEEEANVGQVAQNGVGVATVFAGAKVPYGGISKTKVPARGGRTGVVGKVEPVVQQKPVQANNESKQKPIGIGKQAHNINAQIALKSKLAGLEKAQSTAVKTRTLSDGRIRYYSAETPAKKEGKTRGASFVTEYNPKTGKTRQWMESYNHSGEVIRVHPKSINGQTVSGQHYPPTGTEVQKGAK